MPQQRDDEMFAALVKESLRRLQVLGPEHAFRAAATVEEIRALELAAGMLMQRGRNELAAGS
jgi:hypothetical protein